MWPSLSIAGKVFRPEKCRLKHEKFCRLMFIVVAINHSVIDV